MIVRQAVLNEYKEIASVHYYSYIKAGEGLLPEPDLNSLTLENFEHRWKDRFDNNLLLTLVAVKNEKIVGFATVDLNIKDSRPPMLRFLYIHVDYWRQGIGSALVLALSNNLIEKNFNSFFAWTHTASHQAQSFYSFLNGKKDEPVDQWMPIGSSPNAPGSYCTSCIRCTIDNLDLLVKKLNREVEKKKESGLPSSLGIFTISKYMANHNMVVTEPVESVTNYGHSFN